MLLIRSLLGLSVASLALAESTVYLIRHGEKPADGGNGLNAQGVQRSQCLRNVFGSSSGYDIGYILAQTPKKSEYAWYRHTTKSTSTNIKRTNNQPRRQTRPPLRDRRASRGRSWSRSRHALRPRRLRLRCRCGGELRWTWQCSDLLGT